MGKIGDSNTNTCVVPQCKSRCTNEISLFRFPKDEAQRKKWADAIKIENKITQNMQVCSRHFVKSDYIISDNAGTKTRRLKRSAVPTQNLPWQFPNKRVSPTLAKARMERLKNRSLQKVSDSPGGQSETPPKKPDGGKKTESTKKSEPEEKGDEKEEEDSEPIKNEVKSEDEEITSENTTSVDPEAGKDDEKEMDEEEFKEEVVDENEGESPEAKKDDMPVRAPTRLRQREGLLKCEFCGRKCLTPQALQTHQHIAHKNARNNLFNTKKESPANISTKSSPKATPMVLISVKSPESLLAKPSVKAKSVEKSLNSSEVEKVLEEDSDFEPTESDSEASLKEAIVEKQIQRKTEFECPKCKKRFAVCFMAYKHIQKHHSGTPNGSKASTPKPTRIEICTICNTTVDGDVHHCDGPLKLAMSFTCGGCENEYKTLTMFDMHKSSKHSDGVESMFFSTLDEFEQWKDKMEKQTQTKYTTFDQNDMKKTYRCTHRIVSGTGSFSRQRMCPSSIVVQEFTKGFQVHYYPFHYDHGYQKYNLGKAFQKYSITSLMNLTARQLPDSEDEASKLTPEEPPEETPDLYVQFQKITETLVNEAARINVNGLKQLMRKALEMIDIVNSYVEDDDDDGITSSNSVLKLDTDKDNFQDEVRLAMSSLKRKPEGIDETPIKRRKPVFQSTENLKTPKGNRTPSSFNITENVKRKEAPKVNQSPKFIDTFQDFVGTLTKPDEKKKRLSDKPDEKKKRLSEKHDEQKKRLSEKPDEQKKRQSDKKTPGVKTKIGQFKPKTSPKKVSFSPKSPESPRLIKLKMEKVKEIEYEVKEQENDCNILILKI